MAATFDDLVASLVAEHKRQVEDFQLQIKTLKEQLSAYDKKDVHSTQSSLPSPQKLEDVSVDVVPEGPKLSVKKDVEELGTENDAKMWADKNNAIMQDDAAAQASKDDADDPVCAAKKMSYGDDFLMDLPDDDPGKRSTVEIVKQTLFPTFPALALRSSTQSAPPTFTFQAVLENPRFEFLVMCVILLNTVIMCVQVQYLGFDIAVDLGLPGYSKRGEDEWPGAAETLEVFERVFVVLFTIELLLRISVYRIRFFCNKWHWLDFIIVVSGWLEWIASTPFDPKMLRLLRVARVAQSLQHFEGHGILNALHFLMHSIQASIGTLFWSLIVLTVIQCIAALVVCQILTGWLKDASKSEASAEVFVYYGTFTRSILTMFEILLGNWPVPCRVLSRNVGEHYGAIVLLYKTLCGFAVINVISAVFIQQTMKTMSQDTTVMLLERSRVEKKFKNDLTRLFELLDVDHHGVVTLPEMEAHLGDPDVRMVLFEMGLSAHDLEDMFHLFTISKEGMHLNEFVSAAHAVRVQANTLEIGRLLMHSRETNIRMANVQTKVKDLVERLEASDFPFCRNTVHRGSARSTLRASSSSASAAKADWPLDSKVGL